MQTNEPLPTATAVRESKIKLIAIDLDGTLLNRAKRVCERAGEALKMASQSGVKVIIASARPPRSVRPIYQELALDTWQINYNGALIWDEPNLKAVFHRPMHPKLVYQMIDLARDMFEEVLVSCEIMDQWHTDRDDNTYTTETGRMFKPDFVTPIEQICAQPITKLMLLGDPRIILRLESLLLTQFGEKVTIVRTDDELLQVTDYRVSKAVALDKIARHYRVSPEEVMAIGDAPNDVGMLQFAGVAVAMGNAHDVTKEVADWIAPTNDEFGVHAALQRYGICP